MDWWMPKDECGLLYDRIAWTLGFYNMVRERLIPLPFLFAFGKNCVRWRFALADRGLDMPIHFARHRYRDRLKNDIKIRPRLQKPEALKHIAVASL